MSDSPLTGTDSDQASREEILSALFAQMVIQQANLALMLMGKRPHPQSGQTMVDLEGARLFIDQLEMLEAKTKGNLTRDEETLLKQSLMTLHMAFVESVREPSSPPAESIAPEPSPAPSSEKGAEPKIEPATESESKKKFSRKY